MSTHDFFSANNKKIRIIVLDYQKDTIMRISSPTV